VSRDPPLVSVNANGRDEKDEKIISLGLHIVRNLLAIRDTVAEGTAVGEKEEFSNLQVGHEASRRQLTIQSSLIIQLGKLTYFQLILTLASCANKSEFNQYNVLVLDILHLTFQSVRPRDLIKDQEQVGDPP
jgi:replication fork protection complex subunit Tof1/Swi1